MGSKTDKLMEEKSTENNKTGRYPFCFRKSLILKWLELGNTLSRNTSLGLSSVVGFGLF